MKKSNSAIDKVGNAIRDQYPKISDSNYYQLQEVRTSFQKAVSETFIQLCFLTNSVHSLGIVSYRLKRLESIITKLDRYKTMRLSKMWDIGGCRCILKTEKQVYKLRNKIYKNLNVRDEKDYILQPQDEGYRSLHLFIECEDKKVIEVQLRSQKQHNWATLVEISDLLYDAGLKEFSRNKDLLKFHKLLATPNKMSINDKKTITSILKKYDYYNKLNEVFLRNSPKVRSQWIKIKLEDNHQYFILKTSKDEVPKILSFDSLDKAEVEYFKMFLNNTKSNIVLTHLRKPNFNQLSSAYSNYILTYHSFINEWLVIYQDLIFNSIKQSEVRKFKYNFENYMNITLNQINAIFSEVDFGIEIYQKHSSKDSKIRKMFKYWQQDLNKVANRKGKEFQQFNQMLDNEIPYTSLAGRRMRSIRSKISKEFTKKFEELNRPKES